MQDALGFRLGEKEGQCRSAEADQWTAREDRAKSASREA